MDKLTIYDVTIFLGDWLGGVSWDFLVAAKTTRDARKLAVLVGESEGLVKRRNIRRTDVVEKECIYTRV